jgi:hypothetical protein
MCRSRASTQCAHLISRRYEQARYLPSNAWCLCAVCHTRWTYDPLGWDALMRATFGPAEWEQRLMMARIPVKPDYTILRLLLLRQLTEEIRTEGMQGLDAQVEKILARHEEYERKTA